MEKTESLRARQRHAMPLILSARTIEAGCKAAGITRQTFFNWLKERRFREEYELRQDQLFNMAFQTMRRNVREGAEKLAGLLDTDDPKLLRQVCKDILDYAVKMEGITVGEAGLEVRMEAAPPWDGWDDEDDADGEGEDPAVLRLPQGSLKETL